MRILLTGRSGQIGSALEHALAPLGEVIAVDRAGLDLRDADAIKRKIGGLKPAIIVNAAAYTAVDRAEQEERLAFEVNSQGAKELARQAKSIDALLIHFSTDYVFDGEKALPYVEADAPNPLNAYGRSKLEGERAVAASGCRHFIFRASWVYGPTGRNFLRTILAAARSRPDLRVVDDQRGAPTSSQEIAAAVARILAIPDILQKPGGVYHLSAAGETSWYGFARAILEDAGLNTPVAPVRSDQYPTAARRPKNSLLDNTQLFRAFGVALPDWRQGLREVSSKMEIH